MQYVLQWSESQHQFHIERLNHALARANRAFLSRREDAYFMLAILESAEKASQLVDALRKKRGLVWSEEKMTNIDTMPESAPSKESGTPAWP